MIQITDKAQCSGCAACANVCPKDCIAMQPDDLGFLYPQVDSSICVNCNRCTKVCPVLNKSTLKADCEERTYAVKNKNHNIRMSSSSGGVFSLLAQKIIAENGVVFGAKFNGKMEVVHDFAETIEDLADFRGSKYLQSKVGDSYSKAKEFLDSGRPVLFTGTPCQVYGLRNYLGQQYENLLALDIVCHGVPSAAVFEKYILYREEKKGSKAKSMTFRNKANGWKNYAIVIDFEDGSKYVMPHGKDEMMRVYLSNYAMRLSCHECHFKGKNRASDITLADFWGAKQVVPQLDDDKGLSWVICRSQKGFEYLQSILAETENQPVNYDEVVKYNMSAEISSPKPKNDDKFCEEILREPFDKVVEKYCRISFASRVKRKIKSIVKRMLGK